MTDSIAVPGPKGSLDIVSLMIEVMRRVGAVAKLSEYDDRRGTRFNFRGVDAVINAVGPILREVGVLPVPLLESIERRDTHTGAGNATKEVSVVARYRMYAADGSYLEYRIPGENLSRSDKGTAAAMSVAYRVLWLQALAIPTDDPDPDSQYLTRDGRGELSPAQVDMLRDALIGQPPLAELPKLWRVVEDHAAADRPAPWFHAPETPFTWYEAFGEHLARRFAEIATPEEWRAVQAEILALGESHGLTWTWQGIAPGKRFTDRAKQIKEEHDQLQRTLEESIAAAQTLHQLEGLATEIGRVNIAENLRQELIAFCTKRHVKLEEQLAAEPESEPVQSPAAEPVGDWERSATDPAIPEDQALTWPATARPPDVDPDAGARQYVEQDATQMVEQAIAAPANPESAGVISVAKGGDLALEVRRLKDETPESAAERIKAETYAWLSKTIHDAPPEALPALLADVDGNLERGKLSVAQHRELSDTIRERLAKPAAPAAPPRPAPAEAGPDADADPYGALIYAIEQASSEEALDAIKVDIDDRTTSRPPTLTPKQNERLFARVAARRVQLRKAAKAKAPSLEEVP